MDRRHELSGRHHNLRGLNLAWYQTSIVDNGTNSPTFSYPHTAMSGWLCRSLQGQLTPQQCSITNFDQRHCPNNTSPQGELFYGAITSTGIMPPKPYAIYSVDSCDGPEGVSDESTSKVPGFGDGNKSGFAAIEADMLTQCNHN